MGSRDVASAVLDQSNNHCGNTDVKDNDDSQSFETPRKNNCSYLYFGDTLTTTTTPCSSTLPPNGKQFLRFKIDGESFYSEKIYKSRASIKDMK